MYDQDNIPEFFKIHEHAHNIYNFENNVDGARMNSDPFFRAAAESALRALSHPDCIPLKLPVGKYEVWKSFTFNFDPKNMLQ